MKTVEEELGIDASSERIEYKLLFIEVEILYECASKTFYLNSLIVKDFKDKRGLFINALRTSFREERLSFANKIRENIGNRGFKSFLLCQFNLKN